MPSYEDEFNADYPDSLRRVYNCYTYAMGMLARPDTGGRFEAESEPGQYGNVSIDGINANNGKSRMLAAIQADLEAWGCSANDIAVSEKTDMPPEGYFKIALFIGDNGNFHFLRQVSDRNGAWAHKFRQSAVSYTDKNNKVIYDPAKNEFEGYSDFIGYYVVKDCS